MNGDPVGLAIGYPVAAEIVLLTLASIFEGLSILLAVAIAFWLFVHANYPHLDPATLPPSDIVKLPVSPSYTGSLANTTYWMVLTPNLPLLDPLRAIPVVGDPLLDLLQPDLTYRVNFGYGDPAYGYSTAAAANVPTLFGLFPAAQRNHRPTWRSDRGHA
jgi:PE-PPE domain